MANEQRSVLDLKRLPSGAWEIWIADRERLIEALGPPLVAAFSKCFIQADRLSALLSLALLTGRQYGVESAAFARNLDAMFWFAVGTMREFESAIDALVRELRHIDIIQSDLEGWTVLQELQRWSKNHLPHLLRIKVAFHVDGDELLKGVLNVAKSTDPWLFARGDDEQGTMERTHIDFGREVLIKGLGDETMKKVNKEFVTGVRDRQVQVPLALQKMFVAVLERKGLH